MRNAKREMRNDDQDENEETNETKRNEPTFNPLCDEFCPLRKMIDDLVEKPFKLGLYFRRIFGNVTNSSNE